jgi:type IV pilus assembly protein PilC
MNPGADGFDPIGLGTGTVPALAFLFGSFGVLAAVAGLYLLGRKVLREGAVDGVLLRLPVIGPCAEALALARFCLALRLTTETGMSITKALRLSLQATDNGAFAASADRVQDAIRGGDDLTVALAQARLFPEQFLHVVGVGEESGRLTEVLGQQGEQYQEEAERRLRVLAQVAGWGVWLVVAVLIIIAIFRIFLTYLDMIDPARYGL